MQSSNPTSNRKRRMTAGAFAAGLLVLAVAPGAAAQTVSDEMAVLRDTLRADRTVLVAEAMQFTENESQAFWPLYREYRAAMDRINDSLIKLVLEYADAYPNVAEEQAEKMLKDYTALEEKFVETRAKYLKKFSRVLSAQKALRLAQVESRLDLAVRLQLAGAIPLLPAKEK